MYGLEQQLGSKIKTGQHSIQNSSNLKLIDMDEVKRRNENTNFKVKNKLMKIVEKENQSAQVVLEKDKVIALSNVREGNVDKVINLASHKKKNQSARDSEILTSLVKMDDKYSEPRLPVEIEKGENISKTYYITPRNLNNMGSHLQNKRV